MRVTMKVKTFVQLMLILFLSFILMFLYVPKLMSQHIDAAYEIPWDKPDELYWLAMESNPEMLSMSTEENSSKRFFEKSGISCVDHRMANINATLRCDSTNWFNRREACKHTSSVR